MLTSALIGLAVAAASYAIYHGTRPLSQRKNLHDPAWRATGVTARTELHYDEQAAVRASRRARRHTATGRALPKPRTQPKPAAELYTFRREAK